MPISILMPALSPTMTEGNLAKWHKAVGDTVVAGDVIAEIETDKATMEVEAVEEGTLARILVEEGTDNVPVNTAIGVILEEGESDADLAGFSAGLPAPVAAAAAAESVVDAAPAEAVPAAAPVTPVVAPAPAAPASDGSARVVASPLARRIAKQMGLDLAQVKGTGPHGRIVRADVEEHQPGAVAAVAPSAPAVAAAPVAGEAAYDLIPHTTMRKVIARRLTESKQTVPHFYLTVDCHIDRMLEIRKELNARAEDFKLSVNDMIIRAVALGLRKVPEANASWSDEGVRQYKSADVAVAVAIDGGLITPVIRNADDKGLRNISEEMKGLAARAREGKLMPEEYQGGTFSISNLGMFGIREFAAVINPPQGCILAVGAGEQRPVVKDGALAVASVMTCTLSVDHRVVDGAVGAKFLAAFKALVEDPLTMLL